MPPVKAPTAGVIVIAIVLPTLGVHAAAAGLAAAWCFSDTAFLYKCTPVWLHVQLNVDSVPAAAMVCPGKLSPEAAAAAAAVTVTSTVVTASCIGSTCDLCLILKAASGKTKPFSYCTC